MRLCLLVLMHTKLVSGRRSVGCLLFYFILVASSSSHVWFCFSILVQKYYMGDSFVLIWFFFVNISFSSYKHHSIGILPCGCFVSRLCHHHIQFRQSCCGCCLFLIAAGFSLLILPAGICCTFFISTRYNPRGDAICHSNEPRENNCDVAVYHLFNYTIIYM